MNVGGGGGDGGGFEINIILPASVAEELEALLKTNSNGRN